MDANAPATKPRTHLTIGTLVLVMVNLGAVGAIVGGVEVVSALLNRRAGEGIQPILFNWEEFRRPSHGIRQEGGTLKLSHLDPHLGYAHEYEVDRTLGDAALPGFVIYGNPNAERVLRILTLGGSTTDPLDRDNWPKQLQRTLSERGIAAVVYNGGVSGYTTSQELLKFLRDGITVAPDIVICLNGVNDMGFVHAVEKHPMVHPYQERMLRALRGERTPVLMPNLMRAIERWRIRSAPEYYRVAGVNFGVATDITPGEMWARNIHLLHAVATAQGIAHLNVLQPVLGIGEYVPAPEELEMLQQAARMFGGTYRDMLEDFYREARPIAEEAGYIVDLTDVFAGQSGRYRDARHPNAAGYGIIAESIFVELEARVLQAQDR